MSRFHVGQRVRFVRASTAYGRAYEGTECEVIAVGAFQVFNRQSGESDVVEYQIKHGNGDLGGVHGWQLEPLLPPRCEEVVDWSAMPCDRDGKWRVREVA